MEEFVVRKQLTVNSPREYVWHALINPELTEKYFFGCRVYSNWLVDSRILFKRMILWIFPFELSGRILKINRGSMLQYSLKNSGSTSESIVTLELEEANGRTRVSVKDDVGQGKGAESRFKRSVKGWNKILNGLKRVVENELN